METKKNSNPRDFVYEEGTKIEVTGTLLTDLILVFENLLKDEIKTESKFKYNYVNEKGDIVKNFKKEDVESGKLQKIVDFNRTIMDPTVEYSITEKGIGYAQLKNYLESIHLDNIQNGKAVDYRELSKKITPEASKEGIEDTK